MTSYTGGEELPPPVHADRSLEDFWQQLRDAEISSACISTKNTKKLGFPTILSEEFCCPTVNPSGGHLRPPAEGGGGGERASEPSSKKTLTEGIHLFLKGKQKRRK